MLHDPLEADDWREQQDKFVSMDGLQNLTDFCWRYVESREHLHHLVKAKNVVSSWTEESDSLVKSLWALPFQASAQRRQAGGRRPEAAPTTDLERCYMVRLRAVNPRVAVALGYSLNKYDETHKQSSLARLATILATMFQENEKKYRELYQGSQVEFEELLNMPNMYYAGGVLRNVGEIARLGLTKLIRQPPMPLDNLLRCAAEAHVRLKLSLTAGSGANFQKSAYDWATAMDFTSIKRRVGPAGLVDFLRGSDAKVTDPGLTVGSELQFSVDFKTGSDHSRLRRLSRLIISYPGVKELLTSLVAMRSAPVLSIVRLRNQFASPSGVGTRSVVLNVEVHIEGGTHLCELELVVRDKVVEQEDGAVSIRGVRHDRMIKEFKKVFVSACQVRDSDAEVVANYLIWEVAGRSLRSGDVVFLRCMGKFVKCDGNDLSCTASNLTSGNLFHIEREAGLGPVAYGDVVLLRSKATSQYVDVGLSGKAQCRNSQAKSTESKLRFIVERSDRGADDGGFVFALGARGNDMAQGDAVRKNVHSSSSIALRLAGTDRFLSAMPPSSWSGADIRVLRLKAHRKDQGPVEGRTFTLIIDGSLTRHMDIRSGAETGDAVRAEDTSEEKVEGILLQAYMAAARPSLERTGCAGERLVAPPLQFQTLVQLYTRGRGESGRPWRDATGRDNMWEQLRVGTAAVLRCAYALAEFPSSPSCHRYVLRGLVPAEGALAPHIFAALLALVVCAQRAAGAGIGELPDIFAAGLSGKLMRLLGSAIFWAALFPQPAVAATPAANKAATTLANAPPAAAAAAASPLTAARGGLGSAVRARIFGPQNHAHIVADHDASPLREDMDGTKHDQNRIAWLHTVSSYISNMVLPPLLAHMSELRVLRSCTRRDVALLHEFVVLVEAMVLSHFSCEMRLGDDSGPHTSAASTSLQHSRGTTAAAAGSGGEGVPLAASHSNALGEAKRSTILAALLPRTSIQLLARAFFFACHHEATAYSEVRESDASVRSMTALLEHTVGALSGVMDGLRAGGEDVECEYDVCEAVAQAMASRCQVVPRARAAQLMQARATEALRTELQAMLDTGSLRLSQPTERIAAVACAWFGTVHDHAENLDMEFSLLAITSRQNLLVMRLSPELRGPGARGRAREELQVRFLRPLSALRRVMLSDRLKQLMCFWWEKSGVAPREVAIFEDSSRCRLFQKILRSTERGQMCGEAKVGLRPSRLGIPFVRLRTEVWQHLALTARKDPGPDASVVSGIFIQRHSGGTTSTPWGGTAGRLGQPAARPVVAGEPEVELLLLTTDVVACVGLRDFLGSLARSDDAEYFASNLPDVPHQDSDSEEDALPDRVLAPLRQKACGIAKMKVLRGSPWQLGDLQGVWFLAESESKMRLQFSTMEEFHFFAEGERQRFRRQLAQVLQASSKRDAARGWEVVPSEKTTLGDVRQAAQHHQRQGRPPPSLH